MAEVDREPRRAGLFFGLLTLALAYAWAPARPIYCHYSYDTICAGTPAQTTALHGASERDHLERSPALVSRSFLSLAPALSTLVAAAARPDAPSSGALYLRLHTLLL